ncbi:Dam family site-specific DNA-(adenine-N6)-methyltransferase [Geminocystis sp. NIES-3709]|uniref:DNA adenine methylase n=1 Tax=Geminocystis sp. NIES-3709 TaxID=1617448 RepID=UPI0005FC72F0|nr:Dam family site-specific DNA-(adenine-N6)-methyltransferase [Geminocystis sp. NIES-3709]BAQ63257.1 methyl-directed repair DNA adenine methylase [Geminocystis sp. NIES-3709]
MKNQDKLVKPFLKWAGGKTKILNQICDRFPQELINGQINKYIEGFVGGGAVFLYIAQHYDIQKFLLYDVNPELVLAYQTIKINVDDLIDILDKLETKYLRFNDIEKTQYFYKIRDKFNQEKQIINYKNYDKQWLIRTAELIFLNKTCFNGLFRVNRKGLFNVPFGKHKNPHIFDQSNLINLSKILQKTDIRQGDFQDCKKEVNEQTFVYFDPPYRPLNKTSNFNSYNNNNFDDNEQLRLAQFFKILDKKGAKLMLSNSDPTNEDMLDQFFDEAYSNYNIKRIKAPRFINSKAEKRGEINEILITNY